MYLLEACLWVRERSQWGFDMLIESYSSALEAGVRPLTRFAFNEPNYTNCPVTGSTEAATPRCWILPWPGGKRQRLGEEANWNLGVQYSPYRELPLWWRREMDLCVAVCSDSREVTQCMAVGLGTQRAEVWCDWCTSRSRSTTFDSLQYSCAQHGTSMSKCWSVSLPE